MYLSVELSLDRIELSLDSEDWDEMAFWRSMEARLSVVVIAFWTDVLATAAWNLCLASCNKGNIQ